MSSLGNRVRSARRALGLTQAELAERLGRSVAWVSQVERGTREVNRLPVLESLADALGIDVSPSTKSDFDSLLGTTSALLLDGMTAEAALTKIDRASVDDIWQLLHSGKNDEAEALLAAALTNIGASIRASTSVEYVNASYLWSAISAHLSQIGENEAAWMGADQAAVFAALAGDPLAVAASVFRLVVALQRASRLELASNVCDSAARSLQRLDQSPERDALLGALSLQSAVVEAKLGHADDAYSLLDAAKKFAAETGVSSEYFDLEFGTANVAVHEVFIAHRLGDAGRACRVGQALLDDFAQYGALSPERQHRLNIDLASAFDTTGDTAQSQACIERAKSAAPQLFSTAEERTTRTETN